MSKSFQKGSNLFGGQRLHLIGLEHHGLAVPREICPLVVLCQDAFGLQILNQGVVACIELQLFGSLCQHLKALQEHMHPEWHCHLAFLLELIPFFGLGEQIRHDASPATLDEEYKALVQLQL